MTVTVTKPLVSFIAALACGCLGVISEPLEYECIDDLPCVIDQMRLELIDEGVLPEGATNEDLLRNARVGGCFVTGIGHIGSDENGDGISDQPGAGEADQDSYGGNAMGMKDGRIRGQWQNTTHLVGGDKFHGQAEFLYCWNDGGPGPDVPEAFPNRAIWGGPGLWNHEEGYRFIVSAADYKEGKEGSDVDLRDAYAIRVYQDLDGDGISTDADPVVYEESDCVFGNFQIHPPNNGHPYIPVPLTDEMARLAGEQDLCTDGAW